MSEPTDTERPGTDHPAIVSPAAEGIGSPPIARVPEAASDNGLPPLAGHTERPSRTSIFTGPRPSFIFFGVVAALSLIADVLSKAWAEIVLSRRTLLDPSILLIKDHLNFTLAYNPGGAWGLLQNAPEQVRKPFFLAVSLLAIAFIVSLYGRLAAKQRALKWGLPLVLGGALGNLSDRIIRSRVIDFIDYRADWIEAMNRTIAKVVRSWSVTDHWPTFNVADISICIGVGLMAIDMFTSKRGPHRSTASTPPSKPPTHLPPTPDLPMEMVGADAAPPSGRASS